MTDAKNAPLTAEQMAAMAQYHNSNTAGDYLSAAAGNPQLPSWLGGKSVAQPVSTPVAVPVTPGLSQTPDAPALPTPDADPVAASASVAPSPLQAQLLDAYSKAQQSTALNNAALTDAQNLGEQGTVDEAAGTQALHDNEAALARAKQPLDQEQVQIEASNEARMKEIQTAGEAAARAQMVRVNNAAMEAANTTMHNFWEDKTAGARIMGILAQALSGAANGLAGNPSAPTPLDRIIERDIRMQLENMQNKRAAVGQEQSTMRLVYEQTGSRMAAQSAMTLAAYKKVAAMSQALTDQYATPKAQAQNQIIQGQMEQKAADLDKRTQEFLSQQHSSQAMGILGKLTELQNTDEENKGRAAAKGGQESEPVPPGVKLKAGSKIDKTVYAAIQKQTNGLVSYLSQSDKAQYLFSKPLSMEDYEAFNTTMSLMLGDTRQFEGTGAALSPAEEVNMRKMLVNYFHGKLPLPEEITAAKNAIARVQAAATRMYVGRLRGTGAPVDLDPNDPVLGRHIQNYIREEAEIRSHQG